MKQFKAYEEYKDSGITWVKKIPNSWKISKLSHLTLVYSGGTPDKNNTQYWENGEIPWIASGEVNQEEITSPTTLISKEGFENSSAKWIPKNSLVLALAGQGKTKGMVAYLKIETTGNQSLAAIVPQRIHSRFLFYWLRSNYLNLRGLVGDDIRDGLNLEMIKRIRVPIPSQNEQIRIVDFLDEKTSQIDKATQNKKRQIELLREYEQIMINDAVTGGLNKEAILRNSTHPWIYTLNSKWKERKIQYMTYVKGRIGWQGLTSEEYLDEGEYFLITGTDFNKEEIDWTTCHYIEKARFDEDPYIQLKRGDVLITKDGSIGKIMQVKDIPKPATLNSGIMVTRPIKNDYIQRFFFWVLKSHIFNEFIEFNKTGSTIAHLYQRVFNNFYFPIPPLPEQQKISDYLDQKTSKIRKSIEIIEKEVERLEEYKKILINEAVTGKIKVF